MPDDPQSNPTNSIDENSPQQAAKILESHRLRVGFYLLAAILVVIAAYLLWQRIRVKESLNSSKSNTGQDGGLALSPTTNPSENVSPVLLPYTTPSSLEKGIQLLLDPKTYIPTRPREDVITYTVQLGDNLFAIADKFGLKAETILWGNYKLLEENPEILQPEQVLNILPVDGTYYQWQEGDNLDNVASFFKVKPEEILNYPGNHIDLTAIATGEVEIKPGTWVIIPGGKRVLKDWGPPAISRANPAVARYYGPGSCGAIYEGAIGTGSFVWPTTEHLISGYTFSSIHPAIDIGGQLGNAVYAADSGVVVYAGWSNYGYGNLLVIDHGNGWQTAYAHLSVINVGCGQSVSRGIMIAALGSTGNSSGPHLHFEMSYNGVKVNPLDYMQ
jgi:murein DD-endopeptidase MepM/ murein hydrolase activator NlpD